MDLTYCRAVWGDSQHPMWPRIVADVEKTVREGRHPPGTVTYCYGSDNARWLESLGLSPICLSDSPVHNFTGQRSRDPRRGYYAHGISVWLHKINVIAEACAKHRHVMWIDWDVRQQAEPTEAWYEELISRQPLRLSIMSMIRGVYPWRTSGRNYYPHGGMIYCREEKIARQCMLLNYAWPDGTDEFIWGLWVEFQWGGWPGDGLIRWWDDGYELKGYYCARKAYRKRGSPNFFFHEHNQGFPV